MKITTTSFMEHRSACQDDLASRYHGAEMMLVPGASSCCLGSSSCSCGAVLAPKQVGTESK